MLGSLLLLLQAVPQAPAQPRRNVPDSGVIATTAQVTPAGVQSVFGARVTGVRFGKRPGEIWVSANRAAYRLDWRDNAMLASARLPDRAGVQGVAVDPVTGSALVSSVGKTFAFDSSGAAPPGSPGRSVRTWPGVWRSRRVPMPPAGASPSCRSRRTTRWR